MPQNHSAAEGARPAYLLLKAAPAPATSSTALAYTAQVVTTTDPALLAELGQRDRADDSVTSALAGSAGTLVLRFPGIVSEPGQEAAVTVGEQIRFAHTTATQTPDGLVYEIVEARESPKFVGYRLFITSAGGQPQDSVDFTVRFEDIDMGHVSGDVPATRLALAPDETAVIPIRRR